MTFRVSILLNSRLSLTCFRACFLPGWAKDLSAPREYGLHESGGDGVFRPFNFIIASKIHLAAAMLTFQQDAQLRPQTTILRT